MTQSSKKRLVVTTLVLALGLFTIVTTVKAGELANKRDVMSRVGVSDASNHTISFDLSATTNWDAGDTVTVTFPANFDLSALSNADANDYDITTGGAEETLVAAGGCGGSDAIEITSIVGQVVTFTACASYTAPGVGSSIAIEIGTNATAGGAGDSQVVNPGVAANDLKMNLGGTIGDVGALALAIVNNDQVVITATVEPTLSFVLGGNTCAFGSLASTQVNKCSYSTTVSTNATSGYTSTILALSDGTNEKLNRDDDASEFIDDVADGSVTAGSEEYGVSTTQNGNPGIISDDDDTCTTGAGAEPASALTTAPQTYASATGPVAGESVTLCHSTSITNVTEAGNYTQTVAVVATGNF